jgi:predicted small lipoprotein YifL
MTVFRTATALALASIALAGCGGAGRYVQPDELNSAYQTCRAQAFNPRLVTLSADSRTLNTADLLVHECLVGELGASDELLEQISSTKSGSGEQSVTEDGLVWTWEYDKYAYPAFSLAVSVDEGVS